MHTHTHTLKTYLIYNCMHKQAATANKEAANAASKPAAAKRKPAAKAPTSKGGGNKKNVVVSDSEEDDSEAHSSWASDEERGASKSAAVPNMDVYEMEAFSPAVAPKVRGGRAGKSCMEGSMLILCRVFLCPGFDPE